MGEATTIGQNGQNEETPAAAGASTNLRRLQSPFVGRREELESLDELLAADRVSSVTITGPPGTGKTRLARELGWRRLEDDTSEAVWFVDLAPVETAAELVDAVADVLDVSLQSSDSVDASRRQIGRHLREAGPILVVLDNFEHLVDLADPILDPWLERNDAVEFLVTSREQLGLAGERVFELGPLPVEQAVRLFEKRAGMVDRQFSVSEELRPTVVELVEQLDRLPLATELAAARVRTLPPKALLDRLEDRFRVLRTRDQLEDRRQATLEEAIEWSWDLLDDAERGTLRQCTVFRGGFTLDAAERVVTLDDAAWTVDVLDSLVRKSLLRSRRPDDFPGEARFRMFESIRDFAVQRLEASERRDAERRHARHFADVGQDWAERAPREDGHSARRRLNLERANLSASFQRATDASSRLAVRLGRVLDCRLRANGPIETHRHVLDQVVEHARQTDEPRHRVRARRMRGEFRALRGELESAVDDLREAVELAETDGWPAHRGWALFRLGAIRRNQGKLDAAAARLQDALKLARDHAVEGLERAALAHLAACAADRGDLAAAEQRLTDFEATASCADLRVECRLQKRAGYVHYYLGDYEAQRRRNQRALQLARQLGDRELEGICLQALGDSAFADADLEGAIDRYREALATHRELGNEHFEGVLLGNLATSLHRTGALDDALDAYRKSLAIHRKTGAKPYEATVTFARGAAEYERGRPGRAVDALGEAAELFGELDQTSDRAAAVWTRAWIRYDAADELAGRPNDTTGGSPVELFERADELFEAAGDDAWRRLAAASATFVSTNPADTHGDAAPQLDSTLPEGANADLTCRRLYATVVAMAEADDEALSEALDALQHENGDVAPLTQRSLYARVLARVARHHLEADERPADARHATADADLVVGSGGRWFRRHPEEPPADDGSDDQIDDQTDDEPVDLRRRGSLRRILDALTRARLDAEADAGFDVHELFDIGWPDQQADPDSAADRVYWAVRELRKAGLEDDLQTTDAGYLLDPEITVARRDTETPPD